MTFKLVKPITLSLLVSLLLALLAVPSQAHAQPNPSAPAKSFVYEGSGCAESAVLSPVEIDRMRAFVPEGIEIVDFGGGMTRLLVGVLECAAISVDGSTPRPGIFSDMGVGIVAPDGSGVNAVYLLWQVQGHAGLHARMRSLGVAGSLDPRATYSVETVGDDTTGTGSFLWPRLPFSLETRTGPYTALADSVEAWFHLGRQGLVRISYTFGGSEGSHMRDVLESVPEAPKAAHREVSTPTR